jgi:8-oxo-dGTP diphosphatase
MIDVVCGVMVNAAGQVLACRRAEHQHLGGQWEFPGGKVERGETPAAALVRELREELGIDVTVEDAMAPVSWDYGRGPFRLLPYRCSILRGKPEPLEHAELRWCDAEQARDLLWAAADGPVLRELFR